MKVDTFLQLDDDTLFYVRAASGVLILVYGYCSSCTCDPLPSKTTPFIFKAGSFRWKSAWLNEGGNKPISSQERGKTTDGQQLGLLLAVSTKSCFTRTCTALY